MRLAFLFLLLLTATTQAQTVVQGNVVDGKGAPLPFVNVQIVGTTDGASTDSDGFFRFVTHRAGPQVVQATFVGYETARQSVVLVPGDSLALRFILPEQLFELGEVVATATAYTTGEAAESTLGTLDVYLTAGASGDLLLATKTFPGVAMVDEGAGLFVRGGEPEETQTLLDNAPVAHPYRYESPTTALFGAVPPFLVQGLAFSTGGFSARYGNALSGVLALRGLDLPLQPRLYASAGLAAAALRLDVPLVTETLGVRVAANRSFTDLLFLVNGQDTEFSRTPRASDLNAALTWRYRPTGLARAFLFRTADEVGVRVEEPSFTGFYRGRTTNALHYLHLTDVWNGWLIDATLSTARYATRRRFGALDLTQEEVATAFRFHTERAFSETWHLATGLSLDGQENRYHGTVPAADAAQNGATLALDERATAPRLGAYMEATWKLTPHLALRTGLRADHDRRAGATTLDPRLFLHYALNRRTSLYAAWGLFHQFPSPYFYNTVTGNPNLGAQQAQHVIAGVQHEEEIWLLRLEAYHKPYHRLALPHPTRHFTNDGRGEASGVDVFLKYGAFLQTRVFGRVAYSFLRAHRLQVRHLGEEVLFEKGPTPFDVTHNVTATMSARLIHFLQGGLTLRYATGRPVTPITGAVDAGDYWLPIEGPVGSERLPDFVRLDAQLSYYHPFGNGHSVVFYASLANALNRANVLGYEYSEDYSTRTERRTDYRRLLYVGFTIDLVRSPS